MTDYFKYKKIIRCTDTGENCIGYQNYLKSKHWITLRNSIIKEGTACSICGEKNIPLQLHHKTYKRIGKEKINDLVPLCDTCHKLVHATESDELLKKIGKTKRKGYSKSRRRICKNCRSFAIMKCDGKMRPVCRYYSKITQRSARACEKFSSKRYAHWCRK